MKNIHIFLPLEKTGIKIAEITRGGIFATLIPRENIKDIAFLKDSLVDYKLDTLTTPGTYILVRDNEEFDDAPEVYIGRSEDCLTRVSQHNSEEEKEFQKIVVITSSKGDYNIGHATYLENKLTKIAKDSARCEITNAITPSTTKVTPDVKADLDFDIASIKTLMEVFNINIFKPKKARKVEDVSNINDEIFYCRSGAGSDAMGIYNEGKMTVLKGSKARKDYTKTCAPWTLSLKQRLIDDGIMLDSGKVYIFQKDYEFKSPSTASIIVLGMPSNGLDYWKNMAGKTLKEVYIQEKI